MGSFCAGFFPRGGVQENGLVLTSRSIMTNVSVKADRSKESTDHAGSELEIIMSIA